MDMPIEDPEPEPAQCPLQPVRTSGPSVVAVSGAQSQLLAPAAWIAYEWTPYLYRFEGATQLELAIAVSVTPVMFYNWERGKYEPEASQVRAITQFFGVSMDEIVFEVREVKPVA